MENLHCNRLTCRRVLNDKAVVTTCSHIFCVDCGNEIFSTPTLVCAACETTLDQPDDVVICSLHPSNDYKTSILSGLSPQVILEICSRAISFWQYQIHQESSFQQAVLRNVNERNAQMQKQLENVVREANSELGLLNNKVTGLERDVELERRKSRDLAESAKEKDLEYQKLKIQLDKMKRQALLAPGNLSSAAARVNDSSVILNSGIGGDSVVGNGVGGGNLFQNSGAALNSLMGSAGSGAVPMSDVVHEMDANKLQRTPIRQKSNLSAWNNNSALHSTSKLFSVPASARPRHQQQLTYLAGQQQSSKRASAQQQPSGSFLPQQERYQHLHNQQADHRLSGTGAMSDSSSGSEGRPSRRREGNPSHAQHQFQRAPHSQQQQQQHPQHVHGDRPVQPNQDQQTSPSAFQRAFSRHPKSSGHVSSGNRDFAQAPAWRA